ncbi:hypothetical protein HDU79_000775, partial [Rhizoclosmatium sp. JEL0117]
NYLKNMVGFYEQREMEHWRVVEEKVGVCDSRSKEAFMGLRRRRMEVEREHSRLAKEALDIFDADGEYASLYFEKHLGEIRTAFQSKDSVLSCQNFRSSK